MKGTDPALLTVGRDSEYDTSSGEYTHISTQLYAYQDSRSFFIHEKERPSIHR